MAQKSDRKIIQIMILDNGLVVGLDNYGALWERLPGSREPWSLFVDEELPPIFTGKSSPKKSS
jgi:hypothetical protein